MDRRHDLDWLRVLLFALLVPHHVAVGFVDWGVDIYRFVNNQLAGDGMTLFIYWSHSWRLPSLFLISGIGTYFLTRHGIGLQFMAGRIGRLMVPAIFGFFVLNVFGGYAIAVMTDDPCRFTSFWSDWLTHPAPHQAQHLWFLFSLMLYTLLCWPLFALRTRLENLNLSPAVLIVGLVSVSALAVTAVKPYAAALTGDGYQFAYYLILFAGGYMIGARHHAVLDCTQRMGSIGYSDCSFYGQGHSTDPHPHRRHFNRRSIGKRRLGAAWFGTAIRNDILGDRSSHRLDMVHRCTRLGRKISEHVEPPAGRAQPRSLSTLRPTFSDHARGPCADSADIMAVVDRVFPIALGSISLQLGALACR